MTSRCRCLALLLDRSVGSSKAKPTFSCCQRAVHWLLGLTPLTPCPLPGASPCCAQKWLAQPCTTRRSLPGCWYNYECSCWHPAQQHALRLPMLLCQIFGKSSTQVGASSALVKHNRRSLGQCTKTDGGSVSAIMIEILNLSGQT